MIKLKVKTLGANIVNTRLYDYIKYCGEVVEDKIKIINMAVINLSFEHECCNYFCCYIYFVEKYVRL